MVGNFLIGLLKYVRLKDDQVTFAPILTPIQITNAAIDNNHKYAHCNPFD